MTIAPGDEGNAAKSDFTQLAGYMQTVLDLAPDARESYVDSLPPEIAGQVRDLLQFQGATLNLSQVRGIELALDVLSEPLPTHIGRWTVLQPLGRGGMASVFLVERSEGGIRQLAACKIGYARTDLEEGLRRETSTLLDLNHPGIAHVLDFGHTESGRPWMVSEFVEGSDIVAWANRGGLPLAARLLRFEDVLSAVAHAHERLLLHQDIKPGNILVDIAGRPRLIDFGLASVLSGGGDSPVIGYTPRFASPEQKRGENLTVRSDIYSLGITLAALAEGVAPSRGSDDVQAVIEKACRDDPAERYASTAAMAADLRAIRESRPIAACANSKRYRVKRFLQRHPLPVALGALVVLSIAVGVTATVWQAQRAVDSAHVAERALADARTVEEFLIEDVLGRANPSNPDYDPTAGILGVLDKAAAGVDRRFGDNPLTAAGIHATLASAQRSLGRFEQAASHAALSTQLYTAALGETHELTLTSHYLRIRALVSSRLDEAQDLLRKTDALAGPRLHEDSRLALAGAIARALLEQNKLSGAEALSAFSRVAALQKLVASDDLSLQALAGAGMAEAHMRMEQPKEAIRVMDALPIDSYSGAQQASFHRQLAWAHRDLEDYDRALEHVQRALTLFRENLGNDAHTTLATLGTLSRVHDLRNECEPALAAGREAFEGMLRVYGTASQSTWIERGNFGSKQFKCGQQEEGLANLMAARHGLRERYGLENVALQNFTFAVADFLTGLKRYDEAMDMIDELTEDSLRDEAVYELFEALNTQLSETGAPALRQRFEALQAKAETAKESSSSAD